MAFLSIRRTAQSVIAVTDPMREGLTCQRTLTEELAVN